MRKIRLFAGAGVAALAVTGLAAGPAAAADSVSISSTPSSVTAVVDGVTDTVSAPSTALTIALPNVARDFTWNGRSAIPAVVHGPGASEVDSLLLIVGDEVVQTSGPNAVLRPTVAYGTGNQVEVYALASRHNDHGTPDPTDDFDEVLAEAGLTVTITK